MSERNLSRRELNRALLARQGLLERRTGSLPKSLERIGGIQAQYAPSMYIGLWSRLEGFERQALTRALDRRSVVQGTRCARPSIWSRRRTGGPSPPPCAGRAARAGAAPIAAARRLRARLEEGPLNRAELQEVVGMGAVGTNAMSHWLDLVRVPPSGTWERRRADRFALAEEWVGPDPGHDEIEARAELASSYLRGFGPARPLEIADWAGLGIRQVTAALDRLELRRFRDEDGVELIVHGAAPLPRLAGLAAAGRLCSRG